MRTDGLYAFDAETRRNIERMLEPKDKQRRRRRFEYQVKTGQAARSTKPESRIGRAARLWLEHKAAGGTSTQRAWAALHQVKEMSLSSEVYYQRNPEARAAKNTRLREKHRTPPAL